jgi:hypothetical protein
LTVFALLRRGSPDFLTRRTSPLAIRYAGIDDQWIALAEQFRVSSKEFPVLKMNRTEREHYRLLTRLVPDLKALVGERCFELLESGQQVYLEMTYNIGGYRQGYTQRLLKNLCS